MQLIGRQSPLLFDAACPIHFIESSRYIFPHIFPAKNLPKIFSEVDEVLRIRRVLTTASNETLFRVFPECMAHSQSCCCCNHAPSSVSQSLVEMDFERGIWSAAVDGDLTRVKKFLSNGVSPDVQDSSHHTALHYAARHNHSEICNELLTAGANANAQTATGHVTPLHRAAYSGHCDVIKILLERGADVLVRDADGQTPLHKACYGGHISAIKLLLKFDESPRNIADNKHRTPLDCLPASCTDVDLRTLLLPSTLS